MKHTVLGTPIDGQAPDGHEVAAFALGCFWGAEKDFWEIPGVWTTAVGYAGGRTPNPTYEAVCSGATGHAETVRVVFDPNVVPYPTLLRKFWESHDPTQGNRQGADIGSQYRSVVFTTNEEQVHAAEESKRRYAKALANAGYREITTEIAPLARQGRGDSVASTFWYAEGYHQQYLDKNPHGYCPLHATGVKLEA